MTKKEYMKPALKVVELCQVHQILVGSMNNSLQEEEVEDAWAKKQSSNSAWEDDWSE